MRTHSSALRLAVAAAAAALSASLLRGDTLELTDGTVHRGKVVASSPQKVGFKTEDGKMLTIDRGDIKSLTKDATAPPSQPPKPEPAPSKRTTAPLEKEAWKEKKISFDFRDTPLKDALDQLGQKAGIKIVLDEKQVKDPRPITLRVNEMRALSALSWLCKLDGLWFDPRNGSVVVSTAKAIEEAREKAEPRFLREHDLGELMKETRGGPFEYTGAAWADYFARVIAPGTWGKDKGASIEYRAGKLLVLHTQEVQNQVERLVRNWCEGARKEREKPGSNETPMPPLDEEGPLKGKRVTFEFIEATIKQVCEEFAKQSGVPFVPDVGNLGKAGPKAISLRGTSMGLKAALDAICQQADLGYLFRDKAVLVTTRQEARERDSPVWRTHYLGAALRRHPDLTGQRVVEMIQQEIARGTWGVVPTRGWGPPSINHVNSAYIVVIHTPAV